MAGEAAAAPPAPVPAAKPADAKPAAGAPAALAAGAPAAKPAAGAEATFEVKVNGQVKKLTQSQLIAAAQKGLFADQKLKSMDVLQGKTAGLIQALKTPEGLLAVLKDPALGANPKEVFKKLMASDVVDDELKEVMSKWVYDNVVAQAKKTPEQIEQEKRLARLDQLEKDEEKRKQDALTAQQKQQVDGIYQAVRSEVTKQIVADKTFPKNEGAIRLVIDKLRVMNRKGAPVTAESITKALATVKNDYILLQQSILDADDDPEALISRIGEARALKISKALIARLKKKSAPAEGAKIEGEETGRKVTDRIDEKLGRERHGYHVLKI
jgi:hypothetical protein